MSVMGAQHGMLPGQAASLLTYENTFGWGGEPKPRIIMGQIILASTVDARSSPTWRLQPGLVLGKITATGKWTNYSATATNGSQIAQGLLLDSLAMQSPYTGSTEDRLAAVVVAGPVQNARLGGLDQKARADMFGRFLFDDDVIGNSFGWRDVVQKTDTGSPHTLTAADNNRIFTTRGAAGSVTINLPTLAKGLRFRFIAEAAQDLTIAAAVAGTMVAFNDLAANSITIQEATNSKAIGTSVEIFANDDASKWLVFPSIWHLADAANLSHGGHVIAAWCVQNLSEECVMPKSPYMDQMFGLPAGPSGWMDEVAKTANYTILPSDNGKLFTNTGASGAVTLTLPALAPGYKFGFFVVANQNLTVSSAAGNDIVVFNDAAASTLAFSTTNEKIGGMLVVESNLDGTKWYASKPCSNTLTVT